jgi:excisionase family DNA binding protein
MNPLEHIMGTEEAAAQWGLSQQYIKNLCREGRVKAVQIGKTWVLDKNQPNPSQPEHPQNWRGKK